MYRERIGKDPNDYGHTYTIFQWMDEGVLVPIYPKWFMEEANATYTYPDWAGPWDE